MIDDMAYNEPKASWNHYRGISTFNLFLIRDVLAILPLWMINANDHCLWSRLVTLAPSLVAGDTLTKIKWGNYPTFAIT